jgi:hypothetical protein
MGRLNKATDEQAQLIAELRKLADNCPLYLDKEAFNTYQEEVLQPVRDLIMAAAE